MPEDDEKVAKHKWMMTSILTILVIELVIWDMVAMPILLSLFSCCECGSKFFKKLSLPVPCC